jgi:hypothetical protein
MPGYPTKKPEDPEKEGAREDFTKLLEGLVKLFAGVILDGF